MLLQIAEQQNLLAHWYHYSKVIVLNTSSEVTMWPKLSWMEGRYIQAVDVIANSATKYSFSTHKNKPTRRAAWEITCVHMNIAIL